MTEIRNDHSVFSTTNIMNIQRTDQRITEFNGDAAIIGIWEDQPLPDSTQQVNESTGGLIDRMRERGDISTSPGDVTMLYEPAGMNTPLIAVVGLGKSTDDVPGRMKRAAGAAAKRLAAKPRSTVAVYLDAEDPMLVAVGAMLGCVGQDLFRSQRSLHPFENLLVPNITDALVEQARAIGDSTNLARRWVNLPAEEIYPASFADRCIELGREYGFEVEVWDEERLAEERCNAHLAVGRGSARPPRTVIMRYLNGAGNSSPLALVGKGVTFDSGGLSLKPSDSMLDMKCDMAGGATVVGAMCAIARMQLPVNVIGLVGLAENMVSGNSYKLGDVLTARNGTTIEVHNTDAEGRLVLADTLDVAVTLGASHLVDLATLTGACMVALGRDVAGVMTNNQQFCDRVVDSARATGERVWQLPMYAEYGELIKSQVADIKNVGEGRWGGAITAAKLLERFVADKPWVHIDIAGPSFLDKPKPWIDAGASGCLVHALVDVARQF